MSTAARQTGQQVPSGDDNSSTSSPYQDYMEERFPRLYPPRKETLSLASTAGATVPGGHVSATSPIREAPRRREPARVRDMGVQTDIESMSTLEDDFLDELMSEGEFYARNRREACEAWVEGAVQTLHQGPLDGARAPDESSQSNDDDLIPMAGPTGPPVSTERPAE